VTGSNNFDLLFLMSLFLFALYFLLVLPLKQTLFKESLEKLVNPIS